MATEDENKKKTINKEKNIHDDYNERMTMGNSPDPGAKRNIGPDGDLERKGQKDKLGNLRNQGNEVTGYGGNDPKSVEEFAQGPGFEFEGSDTAMDDNVNGVRSSEQPFGENETKPDDADHSRR